MIAPIQPRADAHRPRRLFVFTEHRNATYIINFERPLADLIAAGTLALESWTSQELSRFDWSALHQRMQDAITQIQPKAVIFSRYAEPHGVALIEFFAKAGIPTFFHLDDLLLELPADLGPRYLEDYSSQRLGNLAECMQHAEVLLASTQPLADALRKRFPKKTVQVLSGVCYQPAAVSLRRLKPLLIRTRRKLKLRGRVVFGYMGSSSHARDLALAAPQIEDVLARERSFRFETLGLPLPPNLRQFGPERVGEYGYTRNYGEFLERLFELNWDFGIAPLVDDDFNRCKTITKFVEYTACEIPTLASPIEPYASLALQHDALGLAHDDDWRSAIQVWGTNRFARRAALTQAKLLCAHHFSQTAAADRFLDIIGTGSTRSDCQAPLAS